MIAGTEAERRARSLACHLKAVEQAMLLGRYTTLMQAPGGYTFTRRVVKASALRRDEVPWVMALIRNAGLDPNTPEGRAMRRDTPYWIFDCHPQHPNLGGYGYPAQSFGNFMDEVTDNIKHNLQPESWT